ncbi:hypothetical protein IW141_003809, partial [Coemansia sp. RSA 355]
MDPEPAYKMINTLFADLGQDSRLNIVFLHLRPADDPYPWRNFLNGTEMKYFYEELVYVAARKVLHDTIDQRVPLTHEIALLRSRKGDGHIGRCQSLIQVKALVKIVAKMRQMLANVDDESMGARFRDFSFVLNVQNIKDACHVEYGQGRSSDSVTELLHSATLFINWDQVNHVATHVKVDYGIEWLPKNPVRPTLLAWYLPNLKKIIKKQGPSSPDYDIFCEKSLAYSYDMAHNRKQVKPKEILKNSSAFQHVMNLSNKVAAEGGRKNLGVRAEYRLTPQSDDELMDFMDDLVEQVFQHKAISKLNSAVVFALKRERNRAVAYMAKRLKEYVEPANFGAPSAEVVEANRRKAHTTQSRQQNRRQARNPVRSIRNRAQRAVTPTRTLQQQQQPVEQHTVEQQPVPGSPVVNLYPNFMPELVTIVDKANIIFRHFKHDFGNAMPRRDVTLVHTPVEIANMEWTPTHWRQAI